MGWSEESADGTHRAMWRDANGKRKSKRGFRTAALAKRFAGEQESQVRRGDVGTTGRTITWAEWCDRWLRLRTVEPSTVGPDRVRIARYVMPRWGAVRLGNITNEDVQVWVNEMGRTDAANASVIKVYYLLSASLRAAVKHKQLAASPCHDIVLPVAASGSEVYVERPQFDTIIGALSDPYLGYAVALVATGGRAGEVCGLHKDHIDRAAGTITLAATYDDSSRMIKPYTKGKRPRVIPLPSWLLPIIDAAGSDTGAGCGVRHRDGAVCRSELLITAPRGGPMNHRNFRERHWYPAVKAAGVGLHVRPHDLRHSFASWVLEAGLSLPDVQQLLGHRSITTTEKYTHRTPGRFDAARAAIDAYGPGTGTPAPTPTDGGNVVPITRQRRGA